MKVLKNDFAIETINLTKYYGRRRGIENISIHVPTGSLYGFLGPNGAGKTTTIRSLLGFLKPKSGQARVAGFDVQKQTLAVRRNVGYLPGEVRFFQNLTGRATLKYLARLRETDCRSRAEDLARILDLDLKVKVRYMSRGMRQKLGIIQAMMHNPALLILDEPTNSLDPLVQQKVYDLLEGYITFGGSVFFSSHIISEVERICDRVAIVRSGSLVAADSIDNLRTRSMQYVRLVLKEGFDLPDPLPEGMNMVKQEGRHVQLVVENPAATLRELLATVRVDYITIEPPSLEEVFMRFYRGTKE